MMEVFCILGVLAILWGILARDWTHGYPSHDDDTEEIRVTREVMSLGLWTDDEEDA